MAIKRHANIKELVGQQFDRLFVLEDVGRSHGGSVLWKCKCDCGNEIVRSSEYFNTKSVKSCGCYMKDRYDITGEIYGRLTVLGLDHTTEIGRTYWLCKCECGTEKVIRKDGLTRGVTISCGCYNKEVLASMYTDLKGKVFGRFIVLEKIDLRSGNGDVIWHCRCNCGVEKNIGRTALVNGDTVSCGCYSKELIAAQGRKNIGSNNGMWGRKGKLSSNWQGGITPLHNKIRSLPETYQWIKAVFKKDNKTCQCCGQKGGKLTAHHIENFAKLYPTMNDLLWEVENGITFCLDCHKVFHKQFGRKENNMNQIKEFLGYVA